MEDIKRQKGVNKVDGHMQKARVLTHCRCASSGEEGVMEDEREKNV